MSDSGRCGICAWRAKACVPGARSRACPSAIFARSPWETTWTLIYLSRAPPGTRRDSRTTPLANWRVRLVPRPGTCESLPAAVAAECINVGIQKAADKGPRDLLFYKNGHLTLRACLSDKYERVWDAELCAHLERLTGWLPPAGRTPSGIRGIASRPATTADILPGQINIAPGDSISPSGLYASDHDMFAFLVAPIGSSRMVRGARSCAAYSCGIQR